MKNNSGDRIIKSQVDNLQVSFDKEAAWMRLQDRMESKDEKKGYSRIGWAAAAMLIVGSICWYMLSEPKKEIVHTPSIKNTTLVNNHTITKQDPTNNDQPIVVTEIQTSTLLNKKRKANIATQQQVIIEPAQEIPAPVIVLEEKPILQEAPKIVAAPKPKMKRVHINDLEEDDRARQRIANQRKEHYTIGKKSGLIKPSVEREDAEENTYSLWGIKRTEIN